MKIKSILVHIASFFPFSNLRNRLLSFLMSKVSYTAEICWGVYFFGNKFTIGDKVFINKFCKLYGHYKEGGEIFIGDNSVLAMGVTLTTHTHNIGDSSRRAPRETILKPIVIESGCWLGANVLVLPGVTIGKGTVVGAGSVVVNDLEPNSLYVGVPAKKIKSL